MPINDELMMTGFPPRPLIQKLGRAKNGWRKNPQPYFEKKNSHRITTLAKNCDFFVIEGRSCPVGENGGSFSRGERAKIVMNKVKNRHRQSSINKNYLV